MVRVPLHINVANRNHPFSHDFFFHSICLLVHILHICFTDSLLNYFSQFGEVVDCVVMKNQQTGKSRGFGFVTFKDPECVGAVLSVPAHILDGRQVHEAEICNLFFQC